MIGGLSGSSRSDGTGTAVLMVVVLKVPPFCIEGNAACFKFRFEANPMQYSMAFAKSHSLKCSYTNGRDAAQQESQFV